eukprot:1281312-Rhodomonas_salina.1
MVWGCAKMRVARVFDFGAWRDTDRWIRGGRGGREAGTRASGSALFESSTQSVSRPSSALAQRKRFAALESAQQVANLSTGKRAPRTDWTGSETTEPLSLPSTRRA